MKEESEMLFKKRKKTFKKDNFLISSLNRSGPMILYLVVLIFYFFFFNITYFSPLIYPEVIVEISYFSEFRDFHNFYNHKYKQAKGEIIILIEFGVFIYLYILLISSFYKVSTTDPGSIPNDNIWLLNINPDLTPTIQTEELIIQLNNREQILTKNKYILKTNDSCDIIVNEKTSNGGVRYCVICKRFKVRKYIIKPDRCHHCKFCDRCILKMDHHCPWVGNCIGFNNYKYFVLMLLYGFISSVYFTYIYSDVIKFLIVFEKIICFKLLVFLGLYIFVIVIMVSLFIFICFHLWIILNNYTTYEYIIKVVRNRLNNYNEQNDETKLSRYNIGYYENFVQVFGNYKFLWFLPIRMDHDSIKGLSFQVNSIFSYELVESI